MTVRCMPRRMRSGLAALVALGMLCALAATTAAALSPARAQAAGLSGSAVVEYTPQSWPFAVSASGSGQLELEGVRSARDAAEARAASPSLVVRDGTAEIEVSQGQLLDFRLVPDEGASIASVRIGGEDASGRIGADGTLTLPAEDARIEMEVAFSDAVPAAPGPGAGPPGAVGSLVRTGDLPWIGPLALAALCALLASGCALRRRGRDGPDEVPPRESA